MAFLLFLLFRLIHLHLLPKATLYPCFNIYHWLMGMRRRARSPAKCRFFCFQPVFKGKLRITGCTETGSPLRSRVSSISSSSDGHDTKPGVNKRSGGWKVGRGEDMKTRDATFVLKILSHLFDLFYHQLFQGSRSSLPLK